MVRAFTIFLLFVYAFSATGATVHLHYCCGELQKLAVQDQPSESHDDCPLCQTHHQNTEYTGCGTEERCGIDKSAQDHCEDVKVDVKKTTAEHLFSNGKNLTKLLPIELPVFILAYFADLPTDVLHSIHWKETSPPVTSIPLFIQHCTYRI